MSLIRTDIHGPVAVLTLTRPDAMNALGQPGDGDVVAAACEAINVNPGIRCAILTGEGRAFSAGGDVKAMKNREGAFGGGGVQIRDGYRATSTASSSRSTTWRSPLIAAVNGAGDRAGVRRGLHGRHPHRLERGPLRRHLPEARPDPRRRGRLAAAPAGGHEPGGRDALHRRHRRRRHRLRLGPRLARRRARGADGRGDGAAGRIAQQPPHALRLGKSLLRQGQVASYDTVMEMSAAAQGLSHMTEDHMEGVEALLEKRAAVFKGR